MVKHHRDLGPEPDISSGHIRRQVHVILATAPPAATWLPGRSGGEAER
jgi:hypothetical protein